MRIKELRLYTDQLAIQRQFYSVTMGFELVDDTQDQFSVQIGYSRLTFEQTVQKYRYHYCFLIPCNRIDEAIEWLRQRTPIVKIENERIIQRFESWNADSVYFYDGGGNLAEFIVRYDLANPIASHFDRSHILCVNEIGMPTTQIAELNQQLEQTIQSKFWKGDLQRFGTHGTQNGLFLLPNHEIKKIWFPTELKVEPSPINAIVEFAGKTYHVGYKDEKLRLNSI